MNEAKEFTSSREILTNLFLIDAEIAELKLSNKVKFAIFGGAAMLIRSPDFRPTQDIDVYMTEKAESEEVFQIFEKYNTNNRLEAIMLIPPKEDFEERLEEVHAGFKSITVYVASAYDIILSKVFSTREKDTTDLVRSGILDTVNLEKLRDEYEFLLPDIMFDKRHYYTLDEILTMHEEYKNRKE